MTPLRSLHIAECVLPPVRKIGALTSSLSSNLANNQMDLKVHVEGKEVARLPSIGTALAGMIPMTARGRRNEKKKERVKCPHDTKGGTKRSSEGAVSEK